MSNTIKPVPPQQSFAERKKTLVAQGAVRRHNIDASVNIVRDNLHLDKIAKTAVNQLTNAAYSAVEGVFDWKMLRNGRARKLLPLAMSAYSIISRRRLLFPLLRGSAVVGGVAAGVFFFWHHRQRKKEMREDAELLDYPDYLHADN